MTGNTFEANEYLCGLIGEYTPALQRFVDSLYLLLEPNTAKEMGANENTCAFYLVNFFGQKDPKAKAEEERLRQEAEKQAEAKRKAEEERKKKEEAEKQRKEEQECKKKEEVRKKAEAAHQAQEKFSVNYYLAIDNQNKGPFPEEELLRNGMTSNTLVWCKGMSNWKKAWEVPELAKYLVAKRQQHEKCSGTTLDYEDNAKGLREIVNKIKNEWGGKAREACILENGMAVVLKKFDDDVIYCGNFDDNDNLLNFINWMKKKGNSLNNINHFTFNSDGYYCIVYSDILSDDDEWIGNVPKSMKERLDEYTSNGHKILSVSISGNSDWAIVTDRAYSSNSKKSRIHNTITKAGKLYGDQKSVAITNLGVVVCCKRGVYYENIPTNLAEKLKKCTAAGWVPTHVSFTDSGTYFISNYEKDKLFYYM